MIFGFKTVPPSLPYIDWERAPTIVLEQLKMKFRHLSVNISPNLFSFHLEFYNVVNVENGGIITWNDFKKEQTSSAITQVVPTPQCTSIK